MSTNQETTVPPTTGSAQVTSAPSTQMPPPPGSNTATITTPITPTAPAAGETSTARNAPLVRNQYNRRPSLDLNRTARSTPASGTFHIGSNRASTSTEVLDLSEEYLARNYDQISERLRLVRDMGYVEDVNRTLAFEQDIDEEYDVETPDGMPIQNPERQARPSAVTRRRSPSVTQNRQIP